MKRKDYFQLRSADRHVSMRSTIQRAARLAAAAACILIAAAACTNDPLADNTPTDDLHDGTPVPFSFTAVAPPALTDVNTTTRTVTGKDTWIGHGTEKIKVHLWDGDIHEYSIGTYTITSSSGTTEVRPDDQPALWPSRNGYNCVIEAWYPAKDAGYEFDVSDQSTPEKLRQADLLTAYNGDLVYNSTPVLEFKHRMTKVRVVLTGVDASNADIEVGILGVTRFTVDEFGEIVFSSQPQDYITACRDTDTEDPNVVAFEALLPIKSGQAFFEITKQRFIRITVGNQTYYFSPTADARRILYRGNLYTYKVPIPAATPTTRTTSAARHITLPHDAVVTSTRTVPATVPADL